MKILINGTEKTLNNPLPLNEVIQQFTSRTKNVIAEVNGEIVSYDAWGNRVIQNGDSIELVNFVGGG